MTRDIAQNRVIVRGAGEMASGVIRRLVLAGFEVIALEKPDPCCVRRYVCYAEAYFRKEYTVEGITALLVESPREALAVCSERVPLLIDPQANQLLALKPVAVIDGRMLKGDIDTDINMVPIVIGLGPGFSAGKNCNTAIETHRGNDLGRVIYTGSPQEDTGIPSEVNGFNLQRVLRAPADGKFVAACKITDSVKSGQVLGHVEGASVVSEIDGMVRGLIHDGLTVSAGQKIGDVDPRCVKEHCYRMSDKADTIGRGVIEALVTLKAKLNVS